MHYSSRPLRDSLVSQNCEIWRSRGLVCEKWPGPQSSLRTNDCDKLCIMIVISVFCIESSTLYTHHYYSRQNMLTTVVSEYICVVTSRFTKAFLLQPLKYRTYPIRRHFSIGRRQIKPWWINMDK